VTLHLLCSIRVTSGPQDLHRLHLKLETAWQVFLTSLEPFLETKIISFFHSPSRSLHRTLRNFLGLLSPLVQRRCRDQDPPQASHSFSQRCDLVSHADNASLTCCSLNEALDGYVPVTSTLSVNPKYESKVERPCHSFYLLGRKSSRDPYHTLLIILVAPLLYHVSDKLTVD